VRRRLEYFGHFVTSLLPQTKALVVGTGYLVSVLLLACSGSGGDSVGANGGAVAQGGNTTTNSGSGVTASGGTQGTGGAISTGGVPSNGGQISSTGGSATGGAATGGAPSTGGNQSSGGIKATGGSAVATGGANATGGRASTGGATVNGGASSTGGSVGTGGVRPTGGAAAGGAATGGVRPTGGAAAGGAAAGGAATGGSSAAGGGSAVTGPCDIYQAGNTPCVAAHSTVRALYGAYAGKLYQLRRASDKTTRDILVLAAGGVADTSVQTTFCSGTTCTISIIYDQSSQHNDLTLTSGGWIGTRAKEADAFGIKVTLNGHAAYGIHVPLSDRSTGIGYRNNTAKGTAKGDEPESMYMVANGKAFSNECCFDYGNAETTSLNDGNGTMEAIYFGNCKSWGYGEGNGPWVMADLENGLFSGKNAGLNAADKTITSTFFTAMVKGKAHTMAVKAGDSQSGALTTMYEGAYPNGGYDPMKKEGAIVLGTGGDNSFMGVGDFFEGAMTTGYATDATDSAVQANIVAAGYGK
jgi:non-reducing end alpha-L-arabinofuranosidase